jgi:rhodanese-related sulfurtransferase
VTRFSPAEEINATQLRQWLETGEPVVLVDVRETWELQLANLEPLGARHIPLGHLPRRMREIDADAEIVVFCHHGNRSERAAQFLAANGYARVHNLAGGIDGWSREVDAGVPLY